MIARKSNLATRNKVSQGKYSRFFNTNEVTEPELFNRFIKKDNFTPTKTRKYEKQNKK